MKYVFLWTILFYVFETESPLHYCSILPVQRLLSRQYWGSVVARIFTVPKRSLGQGNIFTSVCHSVHKGGREVLWCHFLFCHGQHLPPPGHPPPTPSPPRTAPHTEQHPPPSVTMEQRAVRILLECILVSVQILHQRHFFIVPFDLTLMFKMHHLFRFISLRCSRKALGTVKHIFLHQRSQLNTLD